MIHLPGPDHYDPQLELFKLRLAQFVVAGLLALCVAALVFAP